MVIRWWRWVTSTSVATLSLRLLRQRTVQELSMEIRRVVTYSAPLQDFDARLIESFTVAA